MRSRLRSWAILATVLLGVAVTGCASDDGGGTPSPSPSTSPSSPSAAPAPGTVTLDLSGVMDATGLVMLSVIGKDVPTEAFAATCGLVDGEPFSFTGAYRPITGGDPCTLGAEAVEFDPGSYQVIVAVLEGGSRSPQQCAQTPITVDGDVTVKVASLGPGSDCEF